MSTFSKTITANGSLQLIRRYDNHKADIDGFIEIGGSFGGGTFSLHISLSGGGVINTWDDLTGTAFSTLIPKSIGFKLPVRTSPNDKIDIFYTLSGATAPSITLTVGDNT